MIREQWLLEIYEDIDSTVPVYTGIVTPEFPGDLIGQRIAGYKIDHLARVDWVSKYIYAMIN
jgi:hypothetical protein